MGRSIPTSGQLLLAVAIGVLIAAFESQAFGGEISPIPIVALLFLTSVGFAAFQGASSWLCSLGLWLPLPASHLIKMVLHFPDTLYPNTPRSLLLLSVFTLFVSILGFGAGLLLHRLRGRGMA
jgi:hypothetical protein